MTWEKSKPALVRFKQPVPLGSAGIMQWESFSVLIKPLTYAYNPPPHHHLLGGVVVVVVVYVSGRKSIAPVNSWVEITNPYSCFWAQTALALPPPKPGPPAILTFAPIHRQNSTYSWYKLKEQFGTWLFLVSSVILYFCYYVFTWLQPKLL